MFPIRIKCIQAYPDQYIGATSAKTIYMFGQEKLLKPIDNKKRTNWKKINDIVTDYNKE